MAGTWICSTRIEEPASSWIIPLDLQSITRVGIDGLFPVQRAAGETLYCSDTASDLSGYEKLLTSNGSGSVEKSCDMPAQISGIVECDIEEYATDSGELDNLETTGESTTMEFRAWYTKYGTKLTPGTRKVYLDFYHRDTGGTETKFYERSVVCSASEGDQSTSITIPAQTFLPGERLVIKMRAYFAYASGS